MATVANALERMISALELTENESAEASRQQNVVRQNIRDRLPVVRDFISGSYGRNTAIRPLKDIDLFFVMDDKDPRATPLRTSPRVCLEVVYDALDDSYPTKEQPKAQTRSINIEFSGSGIGYDVIPAFKVSEDHYEIPDAEANTWIRTNPEIHKEVSTQANEKADKKLKPLVKAGKLWNRQSGKPVKSFHLEVMAYDVFAYPPESYAHGLVELFDRLSSAVHLPCPEPARLGPDLDTGMDTHSRRVASDKFRDVAATLKKALWLENEGYQEQAHFLWRDVFGEVYPEKGKQPDEVLLRKLQGVGASDQVRSAPDHSQFRFG